jgi:hypothetical protein
MESRWLQCFSWLQVALDGANGESLVGRQIACTLLLLPLLLLLLAGA